jgi:Squalene/phytoene synthase
VGLLPRESRFGIALAAHTYAGILTAIERAGYDVFTQRVHVGWWDKLRLVTRLRLGRPLAVPPGTVPAGATGPGDRMGEESP